MGAGVGAGGLISVYYKKHRSRANTLTRNQFFQVMLRTVVQTNQDSSLTSPLVATNRRTNEPPHLHDTFAWSVRADV